MDKMYKDLVDSNWSLSDIENTDYELLYELYLDNPTEEEVKQDALSFFGTFMSPEDMARAKGDIN